MLWLHSDFEGQTKELSSRGILLSLSDGSFAVLFFLNDGLQFFDDVVPSLGVLVGVGGIGVDEGLVDLEESICSLGASVDAVEGLVEVQNTELVGVLSQVHKGPTVGHFAVVGFNVQGSSEMVGGLGEILLLSPENAEIKVDLRRLRTHLFGSFKQVLIISPIYVSVPCAMGIGRNHQDADGRDE